MVRTAAPWRMMPHDLPPWHVVYQQTQPWFKASVFADMVHNLRALLRLANGKQEQPTAVIFDGHTLQSAPESGERAGYDGYKHKKGSKIHLAVDTLGYLLALKVTPANEQERQKVQDLATEVQDVSGDKVTDTFVEQGYSEDQPKQAAHDAGINLIVVKVDEAKKGFVLLPRRWVVERSFGWTARFRRLV